MNDEDQQVPLYNEIFQYLKHGEYRVDASKSEKLGAIRRRAHSFVMKKACSISKAVYGRRGGSRNLGKGGAQEGGGCGRRMCPLPREARKL